MKLLFDLFPVVLFFAAYMGARNAPDVAASLATALLGGLGAGAVSVEQAPILLATTVAIIATAAQVAWLLARGRKVYKMLWVSLAIIVVMGGATLALRDATFIKWKPTVLYWVFAGALIGAEYLFAKNLIRAMMEKQITLPDAVWSRLNASWAGFFAVMGGLNLFVAYNFSENAWVNFKLFGGIGLMLVFVLIQGLYLARFVEGEEKEAE